MVIRTILYRKLKSKDFKRFKHQLTQWEKIYPRWALETFIKYGEEVDCVVVHSKKGYAVFTKGEAYED